MDSSTRPDQATVIGGGGRPPRIPAEHAAAPGDRGRAGVTAQIIDLICVAWATTPGFGVSERGYAIAGKRLGFNGVAASAFRGGARDSSMRSTWRTNSFAWATAKCALVVGRRLSRGHRRWSRSRHLLDLWRRRGARWDCSPSSSGDPSAHGCIPTAITSICLLYRMGFSKGCKLVPRRVRRRAR